MDGLKIYVISEASLKQQLKTVKDFSTGTTMKFGLDKYSTIIIEKGKYKQSEGMKLHKEYYVKTFKTILKTKLSPKNKIIAINKTAIHRI